MPNTRNCVINSLISKEIHHSNKQIKENWNEWLSEYEKISRIPWHWRHWQAVRDLAEEFQIQVSEMVDLGCGIGHMLPHIMITFGGETGKLEKILAVDASQFALNEYQHRAQRLNLEVRTRKQVVGETCCLPQSNEGELILASLIDQYLEPKERKILAKDAYGYLRPGGYLIVSTQFNTFRRPRIGFINWFQEIRETLGMIIKPQQKLPHPSQWVNRIRENFQFLKLSSACSKFFQNRGTLPSREDFFHTYQGDSHKHFKVLKEIPIWVDRGIFPIFKKRDQGEILGSVVLFQKIG